jgi:hypothetical protein
MLAHTNQAQTTAPVCLVENFSGCACLSAVSMFPISSSALAPFAPVAAR